MKPLNKSPRYENSRLLKLAKGMPCQGCGCEDGSVVMAHKGWFAKRFIEDDKKIKCSCVICGKNYWLPESKAHKYKTCGGECKTINYNKAKLERMRLCETCGIVFYPRNLQIANGVGKFCSQKCNTSGHMALNSKEAQIKSKESFRLSIATGKYTPKTGEKNKRWTGGAKASRERNKHKLAGRVKKYRGENPDKVREWAQSRQRRKNGRLPNGTVALIRNAQGNRCAICKITLDATYHVDHIYPLALGGEHKKENIQILCKTCNVRKSAKDPIKYMQEIGFLL